MIEARLRHEGGSSWEEVAQELGVDRPTPWRASKTCFGIPLGELEEIPIHELLDTFQEGLIVQFALDRSP